MRQVLAALDFSEVTRAVVEQAAALAEAFDAELTLVHVAAPDPTFVSYDTGPQFVRDARAQALRQEHREIQALAEALRERGLRAKALLVQGPTVETILREARELSVDFLVIGSHGRGALRDALAGSVAQRVLRETPCPVVVIRSAGAGS